MANEKAISALEDLVSVRTDVPSLITFVLTRNQEKSSGGRAQVVNPELFIFTTKPSLEHLAPALGYSNVRESVFGYVSYNAPPRSGEWIRFTHVSGPVRDMVEIAFFVKSPQEELPDVVVYIIKQYVQWLRDQSWKLTDAPRIQVRSFTKL